MSVELFDEVGESVENVSKSDIISKYQSSTADESRQSSMIL